MIQLHDFLQIIPLVIISLASILALMVDVMTKNKSVVFWFSILSVAGALVSSFYYVNQNFIGFNEFIKVSNISTGFTIIILVGILITIFASKRYLEKENINFGEFYSLLLFSVMGMMLMIIANDILIIFLGLELMSICFYVLAGFMRTRRKSNESAMKYFLLGAFMTGFLLYGIALMYGIAGSTKLTTIFSRVDLYGSPLFLIGLGLFILGFFFKMGIFPFHMWIPDVYDGAPTIVSGMMSTAGKIAAVGTIAPIIIIFNIADYRVVFSVAAILTMMFGNVIALAQTNMKRLLAYSSIASAGYIMVGIASMNDFALKGIMYYLIAYTFMQLGAFIVVSIIEKPADASNDFKNISINDYKGLAKRNPMLAAMLTMFLFSLAGIPPFAGFWGKYYLFYAAIKSNLIWLSIIGIVLSVISVYYYIKVIVYMWFQEPEGIAEHEYYKVSALGTTAIALAIVGTIIFGVYPELFFAMFKI